MTTAASAPLLIPRRPSTTRALIVLFGAAFVVRVVYGALTQLLADESLYWTWSRHLAGGYLDHPPLVAVLIRLSTLLFGDTELGVRFFAIVLSLGAAGTMTWLEFRLTRDERLTAWCALLLVVSPLLAVLGSVMTPDTPAIFFSACATAVAALVADEPDRHAAARWLLFGALTGLALLAKYTAVLLPLSVVAALLTSREGRTHFRRPWVYLAAVVALLIFSPVVYWNARHDWVSFRFQLGHGLGSGDLNAVTGTAAADPHVSLWNQVLHAPVSLGAYLGGQAVIWNPVLLALGAVAVAWNVRRYRTILASRRVLLWCAAVPFVFFALASLHTRGEMNWPAFAYFPLTILTVEYVARTWAGARLHWLKVGLAVAVGGFVVVQSLGLLVYTRLPLPKKLTSMAGWKDFGKALDARRAGLPVVAATQGEAGEMSFYLPGKPDVWVSSDGSRPAASDYFDDRPDPRAWPRVLFVGTHADRFCARYGFAPERPPDGAVRVSLPGGRSPPRRSGPPAWRRAGRSDGRAPARRRRISGRVNTRRTPVTTAARAPHFPPGPIRRSMSRPV